MLLEVSAIPPRTTTVTASRTVINPVPPRLQTNTTGLLLLFTVYIPLQLCPLVLGLFRIQIFFHTILLESFKVNVILRRLYIINDVCVLSNEFIKKNKKRHCMKKFVKTIMDTRK